MPIVNSFNLNQKTYKNNIVLKNMPQKTNPSFCGIPGRAIVNYADGLIKKTEDIADPKKIIQITEDIFEAIDNSMLCKNKAPVDDQVIMECLRDEIIAKTLAEPRVINSEIEEAISNGNLDSSKNSDYLKMQKNSLKNCVNKIKDYVEKWTRVEQYVKNPNRETPAPQGYESFENFSNMFSGIFA